MFKKKPFQSNIQNGYRFPSQPPNSWLPDLGLLRECGYQLWLESPFDIKTVNMIKVFSD